MLIQNYFSFHIIWKYYAKIPENCERFHGASVASEMRKGKFLGQTKK